MSLSELFEAQFDFTNTMFGTRSLFFIIAFALLSVSSLFLSVVVANIIEVVKVLISRWGEAAIPVAPDERLRTALRGWGSDYLLYYGGAALTSIVGVAPYGVLGFLTFFYSWPHMGSAAQD